MGLLEVIRGPEGGGSDSVYECRNCGTTVSSETDECPVCGSSEIATYRF
jgi:rubrerythrin